MVQTIPLQVLRELVEKGTVPLSERDSLAEVGNGIPVSAARSLIEETFRSAGAAAGVTFGQGGKQLERLSDGTFAVHQSAEVGVSKIHQHSKSFTDLRQAIDEYLSAREEDFPNTPEAIRFDWSS